MPKKHFLYNYLLFMMQQWIDRIIGSNDNFGLEHRILNLSALLTALGFLSYILFSQQFQSFLYFQIYIIISFVSFSIIYYLSRFKAKYKLMTPVFGVLSIGGFNIAFIFTGGFKGLGTLLLVQASCIMIYNFVSSSKHLGITLIIWVNFITLIVLDYFYGISEHFISDKELFVDTIFVVSTGLWVSYIVTVVAKKNFEKERRRVYQKNRELWASKRQVGEALEKEKELNELRSMLISMAAHQFKTPLAIINTNLIVLQKLYETKLKDVEKAEQHLDQMSEMSFKSIFDAVERTSLLISNVLDVEKNSNFSFHEMEEYSVVTICQQIAKEYHFIDAENRVAKISIEGEERNLYGDGIRIKEAMDNLVSNSFKYSQGKIAPEIRIQFSLKRVVITVQDFGIGIEEEDLKHLFEPFYRGKTVGEKISGTGLGLLICKKIIEGHKGRISIKSEVNKGTAFTVILPYENNLQEHK